MHDREVQAGIEFLKTILSGTRVRIERITALQNREAHVFVFMRGENSHQIVISEEFLSDLPGTKEYQQSAKQYFRDLENRLQNLSASDFYSLAGIPVRISIDWPWEAMPNRDASFVHVYVHDLRNSNSVAVVSVYMTGQQHRFELMADPFLKERCIVNTVRKSLDRNELTFFPQDKHPTNLPTVALETKTTPVGEEALREFMLGKVYWLGFKSGERRTKVFIADSWDGHYLGVGDQTLVQTAQVLEAEDLIALDASQEFASAGKGLLVRASPSGTVASLKGPDKPDNKPDWNPRPLWDVFISHASEDKQDFVKPLANALVQEGLRVWYDEFELQMGDSLRRSIDRGLRDSRFGIVVLSPDFFAKEWPQRELDGLAARETSGGKKVILPIWHNITKEDVLRYSPTLADRVAIPSTKGLKAVVEEILKVVRPKE